MSSSKAKKRWRKFDPYYVSVKRDPVMHNLSPALEQMSKALESEIAKIGENQALISQQIASLHP